MMSNARTMSPSAPRSTLEELLESLKKIDDKPKDAPPPLPQRPTSRARLPSTLRGKKAMGMIINVLPLNRNSDSGKKVEKTEPRVCNEPSSDVIEEKESGFSSVNEFNGNGIYEDHTCALEPGEIASIVNNYMGEDREACIPSYFDAVSELPYETTYVNSEDIVHDNKQRTLAELQLESQESSTDLEPTTTSQAKDLVPNYDTTTPPLPLKSNVQKEIRRANARKRWKELSLKKDSRVWCRSSEGSWVLGVVRSTDKAASLITTSDGKIIKSEVEKVLPANPDILEGVDDLIQLSYLNEPAVLHNLNYRYSHNTIYTKAGPVLVAVNPFKKVPIYTPEFIQTYRQRRNETLSPHVYITADSAYKAMMSDGINQSIIISGESGAGKTETAKIAMQYLAALGGGGGVEEEILQTNPILEAFGNAKTLRNNNSSRFGKLIDIHFDSMGRICGAKIQTYLLEKSRVVYQSAGERSYHVFYQLCAGADSALQERLKLRPASHYAYLNQSGCLAIENVNDVEQFSIMKKAMDIVQISREDQESAFEMLAAILWLGNISFSVYDNENHVRVDNNEAASNAAALLHCNLDNLMAALCTRKIHARHEDILQKLTYVQAVDARDALAKAIYAGLFDWLVEKVNKSLEVGKRRTGRSISILDIYGFESFEKNSFEQLCINYANERLQQHFNRHLFKLEQEEYIAEGVDYTRVEFIDNQECLDLIEKRPLGLISLLDEECTFPKATEITLGMKLEKHLGVNSCFKSERHTGFSIRHYAGEVSYDTTGVMEKNRDLLHADLLQLLSSCECSLACMFSQKANEGTRNIHGREPQRQSVATKFKDQLYKLMQRLESTAPHFVRCIKPNPYQVPDVFDNNLVLQQLRCCGVLEVVRITRSGYPTRYSHAQFTNRYGFLLPNVSTMGKETLSLCISILQQFNVSPEMYQVGLTKLFFRTGQIGVLEDLRLRTIRGFIGVQRLFRGYKERTYFKKLRKATILVQRLVRGVQARKRYRQIRERHRAAIVIQKHARGMFARSRFDDLKRCHAASIMIQKHVRGMLARATAKKLKERWHAATVIQRHARGLQARKRYKEMRKRNQAAVTIQKHFRRMRARNEFIKTLQMVKVTQSVVRRWSVRRKFASILRQIRQENKKQALPILATAEQQLLSATEQITDREQQFSLPHLEQIKDREQQFCLPYLTVINEGVMTRISPSDILELQRRAITAEKALREKEDENAILMQKLQQYENRWLEYEAKMNSMEDVWQKQMTSLQLSLAAAKKSLTNDELGLQHVKQDDNSNAITKKYLTRVTPPHDDLDWDDSTSVGTKTPEQAASYTTLPDATSRDMDAGRSIVGHLVKEFEHRTQVFNDDADFLVEVKSGQTEANLSPDDELKKLKQRFDLWKKDFKVRLRDTKGILQKLAHIDASDRNKKKWWGKRGNA